MSHKYILKHHIVTFAVVVRQKLNIASVPFDLFIEKLSNFRLFFSKTKVLDSIV